MVYFVPPRLKFSQSKVDANNRLRRERGGESHKRGEGRKGERVKHKERRRLKEKTERVL